jgi:hypothetical protein
MTPICARRLELVLLGTMTAAAVCLLFLVHTQIYTEPWTIDPWLYTALMANFGFTYHWFHMTYYAARLPMIIPGVFLNSFLTPVQAYVVLHASLFLAGGVFVYLLVRFLLGTRSALIVYPAYLTNAIYVDSHTWDYVDGATITFLSGGLYFLISSIGGTSRLRPALAGFFFSAAAATNLFATLLIAAAILVYLYGRATVDRAAILRRVALDATWFLLGAVLLLGFCGWFARSHGGRFLFFMNSINALHDISPARFKLPTYSWIWAEPRLLVPFFVGALVVIFWRRESGIDRTRVALGLTIAAVVIFLLLALWEFVRSGTFLQLPYYFDMLYPFVFVALAAGLAVIVVRPAERALPSARLAVLGLVAGAVPLIAIYGLNSNNLWGRRGAVITVILMGVSLAVAVFVRFSIDRRAASVVASAVAVCAIASVNYASAANATTHLDFETHNSPLSHADETFSLGAQLIAFKRREHLQESRPMFWYDQAADPALTGLQSLYFYGYTYLNLKMPDIDDEFRLRMKLAEPKNIILLCTEPTCRHAPKAMRRAGYRIHEESSRRLHSGSDSLWVRAYTQTSSASTSP